MLATALVFATALAVAEPVAAPSSWETLEPGLELGSFAAKVKSSHGDSTIRVLRIDPTHFELALVNASAGDGPSRTAREWASRNDLVATINASMFRTDGKTSVSMMRSAKHVNNPTPSNDKAMLVFDRTDAALPAVRLLDRECDGEAWESMKGKSASYRSAAQNIRMISCAGKNVWSQQPRKWSTAFVGIDGQGRILFVHARSPFSTHDLIDEALALPIDLRRAMYVEGGPEAQLYVKSGPREVELIGSYETGFYESDDNIKAWPVPNVIGIKRLAKPTP